MSGAMNRESALKTAFELVEKMGSTEVNGRGYKVDGYRPMTGPERADAVVKLAEFLMLPEPMPVPRARLEAPTTVPTLYGWPIDGSAGPPSPALRRIAKERLYQISQDDRPVRVAEIEALNALIETPEPPETP
jgi:hypothetical protein